MREVSHPSRILPRTYTRVRLTQNTTISSAAIVEWTIAYGFTFYLLTFFWDLQMSKGVHKGELSRERLVAMQERGQGVTAMRDANEAGAGSIPPHVSHLRDTEAGTFSNGTDHSNTRTR